jgi:hypothetical protein
MDSDSTVESIIIESESDCVNRCHEEFGHYNDTNTILRLLNHVFQEKRLGEILGAEPKVTIESNNEQKECTPDALIGLKSKNFLCVEIKAGEGGDYEGIIEELQQASEYCLAVSWRAGNSVNRINSVDTIFLCKKEYWKKISWLQRNGSDEVKTILNTEGLMFLMWDRVDDLIQITYKHGKIKNSEVHAFLSGHNLLETPSSLLVQHAEFLFSPVKPPIQYTAFMLLMTVLPTWWVKAIPIGTSHDVRSRTATSDEIYEYAKTHFIPSREGDSDQIRKGWIKLGLGALVKCRYASVNSEGRYTIKLKHHANRKQLLKSICNKLCKKTKEPKSKPKRSKKSKPVAGLGQTLLGDFI